MRRHVQYVLINAEISVEICTLLAFQTMYIYNANRERKQLKGIKGIREDSTRTGPRFLGPPNLQSGALKC